MEKIFFLRSIPAVIFITAMIFSCAQEPIQSSPVEETQQVQELTEAEAQLSYSSGVVAFNRFDAIKKSSTSANLYPWIHFNRNASYIKQYCKVVNLTSGDYKYSEGSRGATPAGSQWISPVRGIRITPGRVNKLKCYSWGYIIVNGQKYNFVSGIQYINVQ